MENKSLLIFLGLIFVSGVIIYPRAFELKAQTKLISNPYYQIIFSFNQPIIKGSFEKHFQIKPDAPGDFIWQDFNRQVIFRPDYLKYDAPYTVSIQKIKSYALTELTEEKIEFEIKPPSSLNLAKIEPNKLPLAKTIEQDIEFTRPNGKIVILDKPQIQQGKYIDIDIGEQILAIYQDGKILGIYEVSTGRSGMPTPLGKFKVLSKEKNHWSNRYGLYMPYSLQFASGYYIHELPYWPGGYREGTSHLGVRVSHGCVRLGIGPAKEVYDFSQINTPVIIHQ